MVFKSGNTLTSALRNEGSFSEELEISLEVGKIRLSWSTRVQERGPGAATAPSKS